jgi:hypothetical protein
MPGESAQNAHLYGEPWVVKSPKQKKKFSCSRLAGVEWEYNAVRNHDLLDKWLKTWRSKIHSDGSCGYEVVTCPLAGDYIAEALTALGDTFKKAEATCNNTCGIHVHVDARDYSWSDMYRLLKVYAHVEPAMYLLGGQQRLANDYCAPVGPDYLDALTQTDIKGCILAKALAVQSPDPANVNSRMDTHMRARFRQRENPSKKDGGRYRGLNILPWLAGRRTKAADTTIEFRIHRNSLDAKRVVGWTQLCVRLVEWTANATQKDVDNLPTSAIRALSEVIAPELAPWILHRLKEWKAVTTADPKYARSSGTPERRLHLKQGKYIFDPKTRG